MRRCRVCGEEKPWIEFQSQQNQPKRFVCKVCRSKQEQMKLNKGLDISDYMKRWGRYDG